MKLDDLRTIEQVSVFKGDRFAGTLLRTKQGADFVYDEEFREAELANAGHGISFTLTPRVKIHSVSGTNLHPFFAGILPEGLRLRALRDALKTSEDDLFSMLVGLGTNSIGDVYVGYDHTNESEKNVEKFEINSFDDVSFLELFEKSIISTDLRLRELDPGIPGVMPKISASMVSFPLSLKKRSRQYILKLGTKEHEALIPNEHFFMQMAKACGFDVASTTIVYDKDKLPGLLVERFDRSYEKSSKSFNRLHLEDACQFLERYPQDKYRLSLREIAEGIAKFSSAPDIDILRLISLYAFSYLIGNGDLHAKNISLIVQPNGLVRLSPVYDSISTLPYGDRKMALRLSAKDDNFAIDDFLSFGKIFNLSEKAIRGSIGRITVKAKGWVGRFDEIGFRQKQTLDLQRTFEDRLKQLFRN